MRTITVRFETPNSVDPDEFLQTMFADFADMNSEDKSINKITYTITDRS